MGRNTRLWKGLAAGIAGIVMVGGSGAGFAGAATPPSPTLDPLKIPKFAAPLAHPGSMPKSPGGAGFDYYEIAIRQFQQQVLPPGFPQTTVWGYGSLADPATFHYPAPSIEAKANTPVRVKWINDLKDPSTGSYLPHILPVDQTLHWANPPKQCRDGMPGPDCKGSSQLPYTGPVPIVTHLHGAHVTPESDGYPQAWYLPAATDIPAGYATQGSSFGQIPGLPVMPGEAVYQYANDQAATTLWYHDHTLGMSRVNVYTGAAGFYLLRGGAFDLPAGSLPAGAYEIPLVIQDKSFKPDGSLFFPTNRAFFEGLNVHGERPQFPGAGYLDIPFIPELASGGMSDVSPIWNPEFFGNAIVVNGQTWPYLNVEPRRYRLRLLNASNARFYILKTDSGLPFWQIGGDGGFLPAPLLQSQLLLGPAERADVVLDFTGLQTGTTVTLQNIGPDEPFGGGTPGIDFLAADPATTGLVMQFRVIPLSAADTTIPPADILLPQPALLGPAAASRQLSLNELESATVFVSSRGKNLAYDPLGIPFGPTAAQLGTFDLATGLPTPHGWMEPITENPALGATELWEIYNFTADAHPIHVHLVQFEIVNREPLVIDPLTMMPVLPAQLAGSPVAREPWEAGRKDTVISYPGQVTRIKAKFDLPGLFVWHCHILDHEDNEMMRPFYVGGMPAPM